MTIASTSSKVIYQGDSATTEFPIPFPFLDDSHIEARLKTAAGAEVVWSLGTEYELAGAGQPLGGSLSVSTLPINFTPAAGDSVVIRRIVPNVQEIDYPEGGAFPSRAHERGLDLAVMRDQQLDEALQRALLFPVSDPAGSTGSLPDATQRANSVLGFDASGNPIAAAVPEGGNVVSAFMATLLDDPDAPDARLSLGITVVGDLLFTAPDATSARSVIGVAGLADSNIFAKTQTWKDGGNVASAGALALGDGNVFTVTGTSTITSIGAKGVGTIVFLRFAAALTLTHHATDLQLITSGDIVTAAGDWAVVEEYASGDWRMIAYSRADGSHIRHYDSGIQPITSGGLLTLPHGLGVAPDRIRLRLQCASGSGGEAGWSEGDEFEISVTELSDSSFSYGCMVYHDAANVYVRFGAQAQTFLALNKGTGAVASLTNTKWKLVVRAYP